jgi:hypothetical protein
MVAMTQPTVQVRFKVIDTAQFLRNYVEPECIAIARIHLEALLEQAERLGMDKMMKASVVEVARDGVEVGT